jgi:hypothetical protein
MRFLLVIAIWLVMVGGLYQYIAWRDGAVAAPAAVFTMAKASAGEFSLELTPTFSLEDDPFALTIGEDADSSLEIRLNGRLLNVPDEELQRGRPFTITAVEGVLLGHNEIHIKASPPVAESSLDHALRIRVLDQGVVLADHSLWSSEGELVSGTVGFDTKEKEAGHDH